MLCPSKSYYSKTERDKKFFLDFRKRGYQNKYANATFYFLEPLYFYTVAPNCSSSLLYTVYSYNGANSHFTATIPTMIDDSSDQERKDDIIWQCCGAALSGWSRSRFFCWPEPLFLRGLRI